MKDDESFQEKKRRDFSRQIRAKQRRKLEARKDNGRDIWFGLGMFGLIGWSVALPIVLGVVLGVWIDSRWPSRFSWTLMLLVLGVVLGCLNGWYWVNRQRKIIEKKERRDE